MGEQNRRTTAVTGRFDNVGLTDLTFTSNKAFYGGGVYWQVPDLGTPARRRLAGTPSTQLLCDGCSFSANSAYVSCP